MQKISFPSAADRRAPFRFSRHDSAFWEALATYAGDDPLEVWVRFIKWAEQTFTSGGRETEVLPLLERCTRELRETRFEQYRDDARYLRVWVKYADLCKEPHDIFKFLQANDIGQRHTLFYEAYAAFLEIKGAYANAAETYDRGVVMRAQPRDRLKDKLAQFQHRMMRREQRKAENRANGVEDDTGEIAETAARRFGDARAGAGRSAEAENPGGAARGVVGGGVAGTVGAPPVGAGGSKRGRGMRGAAAAAAAAASGSANADDGGLEVYCDDENSAPEAPAGEWRNMPAYQETRKENSRAATAWAGQRLKQKRSRPGQAGALRPAPRWRCTMTRTWCSPRIWRRRTPRRRRARRGKTPTRCAGVWTRAARASPAPGSRPTPCCTTSRARRRLSVRERRRGCTARSSRATPRTSAARR